jgi:hypothetical protein
VHFIADLHEPDLVVLDAQSFSLSVNGNPTFTSLAQPPHHLIRCCEVIDQVELDVGE